MIVSKYSITVASSLNALFVRRCVNVVYIHGLQIWASEWRSQPSNSLFMGGGLIVSATYTPALESEHLRLVSIGVIEEYMYTV